MRPGPRCPGVDRHTHLEGSLDQAWLRGRALARGTVPPASLEALWRGEPVPFQAFIEAFLFGCSFLTDAEAVRAAVAAAVGRLPEPGTGPRGLDLWVSPHFLVAQARHLTLEALWQGLEAGIRDAGREGVRVAVVIDAVNHFGPQHGHAVLDLVLPDRPAWVVGFSTGGLEQVPFRDWAPVFERARRAGLRLAAHAGENGPGSNVRDAVEHAGVERIVHGVRAAADPALIDLLVERQIALDLCPSSNRALVPDLGEHPLPRLVRAGVRCGLGTDDPGLIPATLAGEWAQATAMGLTPEEQAKLAADAEAGAWCLAGAIGA